MRQSTVENSILKTNSVKYSLTPEKKTKQFSLADK